MAGNLAWGDSLRRHVRPFLENLESRFAPSVLGVQVSLPAAGIVSSLPVTAAGGTSSGTTTVSAQVGPASVSLSAAAPTVAPSPATTAAATTGTSPQTPTATGSTSSSPGGIVQVSTPTSSPAPAAVATTSADPQPVVAPSTASPSISFPGAAQPFTTALSSAPVAVPAAGASPQPVLAPGGVSPAAATRGTAQAIAAASALPGASLATPALGVTGPSSPADLSTVLAGTAAAPFAPTAPAAEAPLVAVSLSQPALPGDLATWLTMVARLDAPEHGGDAGAPAAKPPAPAGEDMAAAAPAVVEEVAEGTILPDKPTAPLPGAHKAALPRPESADVPGLDALLAEAPNGLILGEADAGPPAAEKQPAGNRGLTVAVVSCGAGTYWATRLRSLREDALVLPPGSVET
jgi:hypothetical protein